MNKTNFLLTIESCFYVIGRGTFVIGEVHSGKIQLGDTLKVIAPNKTMTTTCERIEKRRNIVTEAREGDRIAVCLRNIAISDISTGMQLTV